MWVWFVLQRIPPKFVQEHGDKFGEDATLFEPAASRQLMWPIKLDLKRDSIHHYSVFVAGSGWEEFIRDHQVGEGDQVVFVLVGLSEFVVFTFNPDGLRKLTCHNPSINACKFSSITKRRVRPASSETPPRNNPRTNPTKRMRLMSDPISNSKANPAAHQIPSSSAQYDLKSNLENNDAHVKSVEVTRSSEDEATKTKTIEEKVMQFNATLERRRPSDPGADSSSAASSCPNQFLKTMVETNFRGSFGNPKSARLVSYCIFHRSTVHNVEEELRECSHVLWCTWNTIFVI